MRPSHHGPLSCTPHATLSLIRTRPRIPSWSHWLAIVFVVAGCVGPRPEERLAAAVQDSYPGVVIRVETREGSFVDPALVRFIVRPGTSHEIVRRIACASSQEFARSLGIQQSIYVEAETEDGSISEGGTTLGCDPSGGSVPSAGSSAD